MEDNIAKEADSRIDALQSRGRLEADEADALRRAFAREPAAADAPRSPSEREFPAGGRAFLSGQISADELRRRGRRQAVGMGVGFAVLLAVASTFLWSQHVPLSERLPIGLLLSLGAGATFGWTMYLVVVRPAVDRHIKLREAAGPLRAIERADAGQCPACRAEQFEVWTWRKPAMLHWILNPGLAFNELVLGQRLPAKPKVCRQCGSHSVDCPHCHSAIDAGHWAGSRAFGHWDGLRCPYCAGRLPMLSNGLAWVVRAPLAAIAGLFSNRGGRS